MIATLASYEASKKESGFRVSNTILSSFQGFLTVNMRLEPSTIRLTMEDVRRFLAASDFLVSYENIRKYLEGYMKKKAPTYNTEITSLRRFIRDFLKRPDLIMSFKMAPVDDVQYYEDLPSKEQIAKGFSGLKDDRARALYLFTASTGLRRGEILGLLKTQIDMKSRAVIPRRFTRKKRSGITFYNEETAIWLEKYLNERNDGSDKLFKICEKSWRQLWKRASESAGVRIRAKILRAWFSTEMGELGCPDRFVDVFQGRAPRGVLAKHYTGKGLDTLKRVYKKANLKIL